MEGGPNTRTTVPSPSLTTITAFSSSILRWFEQNRRNFSWRDHTDVYFVIVAEILLRKTDAKKVTPVYRELVRRYPSFEALARADHRILTKMMVPLGIYRTRPRQLKRIAKIFVEKFHGNLPDDPEVLLSSMRGLGVGRYVVNAVYCLSIGRDLPMLDSNSIRILQRVFGLVSNKKRPRDDPNFWDFLATLIPKGNGRDLNLGLIDFGATVCTANNPRCTLCPLNSFCVYYESLKPTR